MPVRWSVSLPMQGINNTLLFCQIIVGGILVLSSYAWALMKKDAEGLWGGVKWPCVRGAWALSGLLTAIAFLYIAGVLLFDESVVPDVDFTLINIAFAVIVWPAATWAPITFMAIKRRESLIYVFVALMLVAMGSVGVLFCVAPLKSDILNICAAMLIFQHLMLDHILWFILFANWQYDESQRRELREYI